MLANKNVNPRQTPWTYALIAAVFVSLPCFLANAEQPDGGRSADNAPSSTAAAQPAKEAPSDWPEGTTVTGRVVDFQGTPVANAEVILLGTEHIIVEAHASRTDLRKSWFSLSQKTGRIPDPPSTRTDIKGDFSIVRNKGAANRIAVIGDDPLMWVVFRKDLPDSDKLKITLPQSGNLTIQCDLPGKPEKQPVMIHVRPFDQIGLDTDALRFHCAEHTAANPGMTVFENPPPGRCYVERNQLVQTGEHAQLINFADRQLVDIRSNQAAGVRFEHKVGRPLTGRVRGLENNSLNFAHVTVSYFLPEEIINDDGKHGSLATAFDVVPIQSDGKFTTDPIPPGKYWIDLHAISSQAPKGSPQQADFIGHLNFTVPESGETPKIEFDAKGRKEP